MKSILVSLCLLLCSLSAHSWTEKWPPPSTKLTQLNFLSEFLRANLGKIGELAADQLDQLLSDPAKQVKLARSTLDAMDELYEKYQRSRAAGEQAAREEAARAYIALIESDPYINLGPSGSALNLKAGFSARYGVARLTWDRQVNRAACQRWSCFCPDGSSRPDPLWSCSSWGAFGPSSVPPSCKLQTDYVDTESEYKIYRNSKLIATFEEKRSVSSGNSHSIGGSFGPINVRLTAVVPPSALGSAGSAGPFYDFDPQNENVGTPLQYRVEARSSGCSVNHAPGRPYNNSIAGVSMTNATVILDANGDGRPDYYPPGPFVAARQDPNPRMAVWNPTEHEIVWYWQAAEASLKTTITGQNPTGTVSYFVGGQLRGTRTLSNGSAEIPLSVLVPGPKVDQFDVLIQYSGDGANLAGIRLTQVALYRD